MPFLRSGFGLLGGGATIIGAPVDFDYVPPAPFAIQSSGGAFSVVSAFDISAFAPTGKAYYVDVATGNDSTGDGTDTKPYKSLNKVSTLTDYDVIYVKPGIYKRSLGGTDGATFSRSAAIKKWPGQAGTVILTSAQSGLSWALDGTYTNTYKTTRSSTDSVLDVSRTDADGDYLRLTLRADAAGVDANPGSYYISGSTVYVRLTDDRAPDANVWPMVTNVVVFNGNVTCYLEDMIVIGGVGGAVYQISTGAGQTPKFYAKNCTFSHSVANGVTLEGVTEAILQGCAAYKNLGDGYNYHARNSIVPHAIEITCVGRHNGQATGVGNDNGSSMHDSGSVIRVNGDYHHNIGPNVVDIGPCESWNLGCLAHHAASDAATNFGFQIDGDMWLHGCNAHDNANADLQASPGDTMYTRDTTYTTTAGGGTFTAY